MNYFKIEIVGETPLNDEQAGKCLDAIHDYVEYVFRGDCGIIYTPIDEQGEPIKESIPLEFIMQYIESHGLYTSAMEVVSAWREGQMENEFDQLNEETKQAIKDSFEHPERGERYESFEDFKEAINRL